MRGRRLLLAIAALTMVVVAAPTPSAAGDFDVGPFQRLGGDTDFAPAATSWSPGRLDVFVTGTDRQLWHTWYADGWAGWEPLGGQLISAPAVTSWAPGRLDVFGVGTDRQLWHKWFDGAWSGWEPLGGQLTGTPAVTDWGPGRLDVFGRGTDGQSWHRFYAGTWSGWEPLGGQVAGLSAAAWGPGRIDVFTRGTDGQLYHQFYAGGWSPWFPLGGVLTADPAAASWGPGRLDVFVRGLGNVVYHRSYEGGWGGFGPTADSQPVSTAPAAVGPEPGVALLFAALPSGEIGAAIGVKSVPPVFDIDTVRSFAASRRPAGAAVPYFEFGANLCPADAVDVEPDGNDNGAGDVQGVELSRRCGDGMYRAYAPTRDPLGNVTMWIEADTRPGGCGGVDRVAYGRVTPDTQPWIGDAIATPTCSPSTWQWISAVGVSPFFQGFHMELHITGPGLAAGAPFTFRTFLLEDDDPFVDALPNQGVAHFPGA